MADLLRWILLGVGHGGLGDFLPPVLSHLEGWFFWEVKKSFLKMKIIKLKL
jgi:hypothetical protein